MELIKEKIRHRFQSALKTYDQHATAQQEIHKHLIELLGGTWSEFERVLEIGCGTGGLTGKLSPIIQTKEWILNDLCKECEDFIPKEIKPKAHFLCGDAEKIDFPGKYDLIISSSVIQWFTNPKAFIKKMHSLLNQQGWILFSTFAPDNMFEIKTITGKGLNYLSLQEWETTLNKSFEILHAEEGKITLFFDTPLEVLHHIKATGVNATGGEFWNRNKIKIFEKEYSQRYTVEKKVSLTYRPLYLLAQKKDVL